MPHLSAVKSELRDDIKIGAQNCGNNVKGGAYTGETAAFQIKDLGCEWVIIGHSERRSGFGGEGESSELCAQKCKIAVDAGLKVMFAIGEQKEERENGTTMAVCAIGTGLTATPEMAQATHADIRKWISDNVDAAIANKTRIQYGGSMKGANAVGLLAQPDIDGGLIGGASLKADFFNVINGIPK